MTRESRDSTGSAPSTTVVFFGLGAVGSAMLICLAELAERDGVPLRFVVVVLNPDLARDALFHAERLFDRVDFIGVDDFAPLWSGTGEQAEKLVGATLLVNAALPEFNRPLIELGLRLGAHTGPVYSQRDPLLRRDNFFGAHVSRAARIEPITPVGDVYVTEAFAADLALQSGLAIHCDYVGHMPAAKGYGNLRMYLLRRAGLTAPA